MTIARIPNWSYPGRRHGIQEIQEYLRFHYQDHVRESRNRVQDFDILQLNHVPWVDVREYGLEAGASSGIAAKNVSYFHNMLDAIDNGTHVIFPDGDFYFNAGLTIDIPMFLQGRCSFSGLHGATYAHGTKLIWTSALDDEPGITVTSTGRTGSFKGFILDLQNQVSTTTDEDAALGMKFYDVTSGYQVEECLIYKPYGHGIDCVPSGHGSNSVGINKVQVYGRLNTSTWTGTSGIGFRPAHDSYVTNSRAAFCKYGCWGGHHVIVSGNRFDLNHYAGIYVPATNGFLATNNTCDQNGGAGVRVKVGGEHQQVLSNMCYNNGRDTGLTSEERSGIYVEGDCDGTEPHVALLDDNHCWNVDAGEVAHGDAIQQYGIYVADDTKVRMGINYCENNVTADIYVEDKTAGGNNETIVADRMLTFTFYQDNVPTNQSYSVIDSDGSAAKSYIIPYSGYLVSMSCYLNSAVTAGTLNVRVRKNGTQDDNELQLDTTDTQKDHVFWQYKDDAACTLAQGDVLDVVVQTGATYAPDGTADLTVTLVIAQE